MRHAGWALAAVACAFAMRGTAFGTHETAPQRAPQSQTQPAPSSASRPATTSAPAPQAANPADAGDWTAVARTLGPQSTRAARLAMVQILAAAPGRFAPELTAPLLSMLGEPDAELRSAAGELLAGLPGNVLIPALQDLVRDRTAPTGLRLSAVSELEQRPERAAAAALVAGCRDADALVRPRLLAAIQALSGVTLRDARAATEWWQETGQRLSDAEWNATQQSRLLRARRAAEQRAGELELRLGNALRDAFFMASETERGALLLAYLNDPVAAVRIVGLDAARAIVQDGGAIAPQALARVREMVAAGETPVRLAAIRALVALRDASDAASFAGLLRTEPVSEVRAAFVNALGYVGQAHELPLLIESLRSEAPSVEAEAAGAIGRLAERGVLGSATDEAAGALLTRIEGLDAAQIQLRDQLLRAMYRLADVRFADVFIAAVEPTEPVVIRQAGARGLLRLAEKLTSLTAAPTSAAASVPASGPATASGPGVFDTPLAWAAMRACDDAEPSVRRLAVEAAALLIDPERRLSVIWRRAWGDVETDPQVRDAAWRSVLRCLSTCRPSVIDAATREVPRAAPESPRRLLDLLLSLEESLQRDSSDRAALGLARARIAEQRRVLEQHAEAAGTSRAALADLVAAAHPQAPAVALEALATALRVGRYDEPLAALLASVQPPLEPAAVLRVVRDALTGLAETAPERVVETLEALRAAPPAAFDAAQRDALHEYHEQALAKRRSLDARRVEEAIAALRQNPDDAAAREVLKRAEGRAAAGLRAELRSELSSVAPNSARERTWVELLKAADPAWNGYDFALPTAEKLNLLAEP